MFDGLSLLNSQPCFSPRDRLFAWQHWQLTLPRTWDPVRIEGNFAAGRVEWADARGPALGLRWSTPRPRHLQPDVAARQTLQNEVGMLAAQEAKPGIAPPGQAWAGPLLYEEPAPPGRDVWSAFSQVTGRLIQIVYFAQRRDAILRDRLLPSLIDHPTGRATPWAVFDLDFIAPAEATLAGHRFNAGDLAMRFAGPVDSWTVRQLAPASLALSRQSLSDWAAAVPPTIGSGDRLLTKHYRPVATGNFSTRAFWQRKRRFFWKLNLSETRVVLAHVDPARDRLILLEGADDALLGEIFHTVGHPQIA